MSIYRFNGQPLEGATVSDVGPSKCSNFLTYSSGARLLCETCMQLPTSRLVSAEFWTSGVGSRAVQTSLSLPQSLQGLQGLQLRRLPPRSPQDRPKIAKQHHDRQQNQRHERPRASGLGQDGLCLGEDEACEQVSCQKFICGQKRSESAFLAASVWHSISMVCFCGLLEYGLPPSSQSAARQATPSKPKMSSGRTPNSSFHISSQVHFPWFSDVQ